MACTHDQHKAKLRRLFPEPEPDRGQLSFGDYLFIAAMIVGTLVLFYYTSQGIDWAIAQLGG